MRRGISTNCLVLLFLGCVSAMGPGAAEDFLARRGDGAAQVRVMNWNVGLSSILRPEFTRQESFVRMLRAVEPDIVCLQELLEAGDGAPLAEYMNSVHPLGAGRTWYAYTASDNAVVSRYPFKAVARDLPIAYPIPRQGLPDFRYGQAFCLVDLPDARFGEDLLVVAMHNKSRGGEENVRMRQAQSDALVGWIREARKGAGGFAIPDGTPMLILGDMNVLVVEPQDPAHHLTTLLTGNILDEEKYGPDCVLDYDGSFLVEVKPRHNGREKEFYTWREDDTAFPPGALDRILYTDSVLRLEHSYVLNTTIMTEAELEASGLRASDVLWEGIAGNYDHLPMVADFSVR